MNFYTKNKIEKLLLLPIGALMSADDNIGLDIRRRQFGLDIRRRQYWT